MKKTIFALAISVLITGCASVPMADLESDNIAKSFKLVSDKANLYIYRNESMGAAIKMPVLLNNQSIGDTAANTYIFKQITPGKYTVTSKTENDAHITIDAEAGKNYFIWQEVKMGMWSARSQLQQVDEKTGQAAVNECKLIK